MKSKRTWFVAGALVITLALTGGFSYAAEKPPYAGTVIHISVVGPHYARAFTKYEDIIEQQLGVKMKFHFAPPPEMYTTQMLEFAVGRTSWDIVEFMPANLADFSKHLTPLKPLIEKLNLNFYLDDVMPVFRDIYSSWEGVLLGIPFDGDRHMLFYNTEAFEKFGLMPPETWDEYLSIARKLNGIDWNNDGRPEYGVSEAWQRGGYSYWWFMDRFVSYGGVYFDEDMNPLLNTPNAKEAIRNQVHVTPYVPAGAIGFAYAEAENAFIKGTTAMIVNWNTGKKAQDPEFSYIVGKVGVSLAPGAVIKGKLCLRTTLPTGWSLGIPKYSQNKEAAIRIIEIISHPDRAREICTDPKTHVEAWRISSTGSEIWLKQWPEHPKYARDYAETLEKTLRLGMPDLQIPGSNEYVTSAGAEINSALIGEKSPGEALESIVKKWNEITDRIGREGQKKHWNAEYDAMKAKGISFIPFE